MHLFALLLKRTLCDAQSLDGTELAGDVSGRPFFCEKEEVDFYEAFRVVLVFFEEFEAEAAQAFLKETFYASHAGLSESIEESVSTTDICT